MGPDLKNAGVGISKTLLHKSNENTKKLSTFSEIYLKDCNNLRSVNSRLNDRISVRTANLIVF